MKVKTKLKYARIVADWASKEFESLAEGHVGTDLAYLLMALLDPDEHAWVDWRYFRGNEHLIVRHARNADWFNALWQGNAGVIHI